MTFADLPPVVWSAAFELDVEPSPKRRHRVRVITPRGQKPFPQTYPDPEGVGEEKALAELAQRYAPAKPWAGPVAVGMVFRFPVPASWEPWEREAALAGRRLPTSGRGGDVDNYEKAVLDAFTASGHWWADDVLVVDVRTRKTYAARPSVLVEVYFLEEITKARWLEMTVERGGLFKVAEGA